MIGGSVTEGRTDVMEFAPESTQLSTLVGLVEIALKVMASQFGSTGVVRCTKTALTLVMSRSKSASQALNSIFVQLNSLLSSMLHVRLS